MRPSRPITVVAVYVAPMCSNISGELHVRLQYRVHGNAIPYGIDSRKKYKLALRLECGLRGMSKQSLLVIRYLQSLLYI